MRPSQGLEIKVGFLVIASIVATVAMIMLSDKLSLEHYYRVSAFLDDAGGLRTDSPVTLSGITIGNVVAIEHSEDPRGAILVVARIKSHERIPVKARLELSSSGIFGDSFLAFTAKGPSGGYLPTDGSAAMVASPGFIGQATEQAKSILRSVSGLLDDGTKDELKRLVKNAADLAGDGAKIAHTLAGQDQQLGEVLTNLRSITADLKTAAERSGQLIDHADGTFATTQAKLNLLTDHVDATLGRVDGLLDSTAGLLDGHRQQLAQLIDSLASAASNAAGILHAVGSGQGVLGSLVFSKDLARQVDALAVDLAIAAHGLEQHPSSVVWGQSKKERAEADQQRQRLILEHNFHSDLGDPPAGTPAAAAPPPAAAPARSN